MVSTQRGRRLMAPRMTLTCSPVINPADWAAATAGSSGASG